MGKEDQQLCLQLVEDLGGLMGMSLDFPAWCPAAEGFVGSRRGTIPDRLLQPGQGRAHLLLQGSLDESSLEPPLV